MLNWSKYLERTCKERVSGKHLGTHGFARRYYNLASTAFFTLLDRYSKRTIGSKVPIEDLAKCFESFATKFCNELETPSYDRTGVTHPIMDEFIALSGPRTLKLLGYIQSNSNPDTLNSHYFEYLKALQEKSIPSTEYQKDFDVFSQYIDFFSKRQAKPDIRHMFEERLKAGQGVSAFQKHVNALLAPYSRYLAQIFHEILKPNVLFASNMPETQIGARLAELLTTYEENHPNHKIDNFANDFTEFDSSQYELSPYANAVVMIAMGAPLKLVDLYLTMRNDWVLADDMMKLYGHSKMHSGEPFTLTGNTFFGMLVVAHAVEFDDLIYAAFKGDDSAICGTNVRFNNDTLQWCRDRGLQLKIEYPPHMEFTGMLVTRYGYFPDVVRKAVKFLSTVFRDHAHYKLAVTSLDADLACINSAEHLHYGCAALSEFYAFQNKTHGISADHIDQLAGFLHHQVGVKYNDLHSFDRPVLTFSHGDFPNASE